jgi:hypothetical protein
MHSYIIYFMTIVEWGNAIVIWNILMLFLLMNLWNFQESFKEFFRKSNQFSIGVLVFNSLVFPCLFCFDLITSELAYTMYCGRLMEANMIFTATDVKKLNTKYYPYLTKYKDFQVLDMDVYGFKSFEAELCRTEYTYKKMFRKLSEPYSDTCMLVISRKPMLREKEYEYVYKE